VQHRQAGAIYDRPRQQASHNGMTARSVRDDKDFIVFGMLKHNFVERRLNAVI